jgi:hypothetical protein
MHHCLNCHGAVEAERVRCPCCGLTYEGRFGLPRLARLEPDQQHLAEQIVLAAGSLKDVAGVLEISYPTLRKRLDALIQALKGLQARDEEQIRHLLDQVEAGAMASEEAARLIKEMNGGA